MPSPSLSGSGQPSSSWKPSLSSGSPGQRSFGSTKPSPSVSGLFGSVVVVGSVSGIAGRAGDSAYSASKAGVLGMALPIARDLMNDGIRVNTILPGIFETPMLMGLPKDAQESLGKQVPFPSRLGRPEEFADLVAYIAGNRYINGETIRLDGAVRLAPK